MTLQSVVVPELTPLIHQRREHGIIIPVNGNDGDDSIRIDGGTDDAAFTIKAGTGDDTIDFNGLTTEGANVSIHASEGDDVITGNDGDLMTLIFDNDSLVDDDDEFTLSSTLVQSLASGTSIKVADGIFDTIDFSGITKDFSVEGDDAANTIVGGTGDDTIMEALRTITSLAALEPIPSSKMKEIQLMLQTSLLPWWW